MSIGKKTETDWKWEQWKHRHESWLQQREVGCLSVSVNTEDRKRRLATSSDLMDFSLGLIIFISSAVLNFSVGFVESKHSKLWNETATSGCELVQTTRDRHFPASQRAAAATQLHYFTTGTRGRCVGLCDSLRPGALPLSHHGNIH